MQRNSNMSRPGIRDWFQGPSCNWQYYMWHDQGKWVTCRTFQFQFSYITFSNLQNASIWCKPHYNWISGYRVMKDLTMLKTIWNKGFLTLFLPISQKQHPRHPTYSSWSCHIWIMDFINWAYIDLFSTCFSVLQLLQDMYHLVHLLCLVSCSLVRHLLQHYFGR